MIDEAFLNMAGLGERMEAHARDLRRTVLQFTGIPVSIGIAGTKTLAKLANRAAKKDPASGGVCILDTEAAIDVRLMAIELTDLWGCVAPPGGEAGGIGRCKPVAIA